MNVRAYNDLRQNVNFLFSSMLGHLRRPACPDCGPGDHRLVDRKYLVARLFECSHCHLRFRHPGDDAAELNVFYQSAYRQEDGITTDLPSDAEWKRMLKMGFGEKSVGHYISLFRAFFPDRHPSDLRVLDYGCSWGYQTWQFLNAGFDAMGFEISVPRASYGRDVLRLPIHASISELTQGVDVFFAGHVIEHVPSPRDLLTMGYDMLKPGGYMVIESPNGSDSFREARPAHHRKLWGRVHPFLMTPEFYQHWLADRPAFFTSHPFDDLAASFRTWDQRQTRFSRMDGPSMLMITRKS